MRCSMVFVFLLGAMVCGGVFKPVKVEASSYVTFNVAREQHHPELTADGKTGSSTSYWANNFKDKSLKPPHWVLFDFGKAITCNTIRVDMVGSAFGNSLDRCINNFKLEYEDEKGQFVTIVEKKHAVSAYRRAMQSGDPDKMYTEKPLSLSPVFRFAPVTTRKVRIVINESIARLDEMTVSYTETEAPKAAESKASPVQDGVLRYSFGDDDAPLAAGFQRAHFSSGAKLYRVDRGIGDPVRRTFEVGMGDASFQVAAAPGIYRVLVISGDHYAGTPSTVLTVNGCPLTMGPEPANSYYWDIRTVQCDGVLRIQTKGSWLVNAVIAAPLSAKDAFVDCVTRTIIGPAFDSFKADPQLEKMAPPAVSEADRAAGYIAYAPSLQQRIFPGTVPQPSQRLAGGALAGQAAGDTTLALSLAFYGTRHIPAFQLSLEAPALAGKTLPCALHPVRCWPQRTGHKGSAKTYDWVPEVLVDNEALFLEEGTSRQYILLVDVPAGTPAGLYRGAIAVAGEGVVPATIPVDFTVLPFTLPKLDGRQYAAMYTSDSLRPFFAGNGELDRIRLADMRRHNMNAIHFPLTRYPGKEAFEEKYLEVNKLLDAVGYPKNPMPYHNDTITAEQTAEIKEIMDRTGLREILFYPVDEPYFKKQELAMKLYPEVKKVPGIHTYSTITEDDIRKFGQYLDYRTYMITGYAEFQPDRIREDCRKLGTHFWWYTNSAREYPSANRYKAGFFQYRCGATGQLYWAYDNRGRDAFNDFDTNSNDHLSILFIHDKLHSTIQWEAIREGLDDLRYAFALEDLIAKFPGSTASKKAGVLLEEIRKATVIDLNEFKKAFGADIEIHHRCFWKEEQFDTYRKRLQTAIGEFN